ncbi:hypothetical protein [Bosea sp. AS-1]|uniref:hypothetical protein n=1 Tax=Bosea sp. AS-1 TaxID=2015316 RepID=UPI000B77BDF1|nr:hypothetical protein [Bosea sp. AS-1]
MDESQPTASMSVSDGRMTIGGSPHRYLQDITRRFRLEASALRFVGGYASRDGRLDDAQRIEAQAKIVDGSLRRAGLEGAAQRLCLTLRPFAASGDSTRLLLMLSYRDENGEAEPFADGFLAPAVFEALKADMLSGLAQELSLEATTNLWIREEDRDRPAGQPADWYLGLAEDGRGSAPARGFIESLEWRPAAAMVAAEPRDIEHSSPAVSDTAQPEEHDEETSADQLRRINWSLKQLLLVLAFLLLIIAVK